MDFVHGMGNGKEEVGLRPTTRWGRKAPDPISWHIAHQTRHNLGNYRLPYSAACKISDSPACNSVQIAARRS